MYDSFSQINFKQIISAFEIIFEIKSGHYKFVLSEVNKHCKGNEM